MFEFVRLAALYVDSPMNRVCMLFSVVNCELYKYVPALEAYFFRPGGQGGTSNERC